MSIELRALFLLLAVVAFAVAAAVKGNVRMTSDNRVRVVAIGALLFVFPLFWDAVEAL